MSEAIGAVFEAVAPHTEKYLKIVCRLNPVIGVEPLNTVTLKYLASGGKCNSEMLAAVIVVVGPKKKVTLSFEKETTTVAVPAKGDDPAYILTAA
jgi:hypothetical protein